MKNPKQIRTRFSSLAVAGVVALGFLTMSFAALAQPRVIDVLADKDSHFKVGGQSKPQLIVKAGEQIILRIDARKGRTWNRDGVVHGFTMLRMKDRARVPGWDFELSAGMHEYSVTAPAEAGEYEVLCTVICSGDHEGMRMKVLVVP